MSPYLRQGRKLRLLTHNGRSKLNGVTPTTADTNLQCLTPFRAFYDEFGISFH